MRYNMLGQTGLKVSALSLGTMTFGVQADEKRSCEIVDIALDHGINFIDAADSYAAGETEKILSKALRGKRDRLILATKVGIPFGGEVNSGGLSRRWMIKQAENSLKNLDTDYIDIYYLHTPDHSVRIEDTLETCAYLVRSGKVRYIGMSNFAAWEMCEALWKSDVRDLIAPSVVQMVYNLMTRGIEREVIPFARAHDMGVVTYNPLAGGFLTGKYDRSGPADGTRYSLFGNYPKRYWNDNSFQAVEKLGAIADEAHMSLLELSLRWIADNSAVTSVILGASRPEQLRQNLELIEKGGVDQQIKDKCDEFWVGFTGHRVNYNR